VKIFFKTFGCRVNQYETEALRERLLADGGSGATDDYESADLCVINTCAITGEADKDALRMVRRIARRNPGARLVVTGCCAERDAERIRAAAPEAILCANAGKEELPRLLGFACGPGVRRIRRFDGHSRAFLKVQDGCDMACTYCVVPSVRPALSCRPWEEVRGEAAGLLAAGYRELVLCGIRMGRYLGEEAGRRADLVGLIERLLDLPEDFRIRLSSLEITDVTPRLLALLQAGGGHGAAAPGAAPFSSRGGGGGCLAPSLHLPLQSGSSSVLERMGRWYSAELAARRLAELRSACPGTAVFTDVMVGFPGETDGEAEESFRFVRDAGFSGLHVFRYSRREGTPAAAYPDQVPAAAAWERAERMRALDRELREGFAAAAVGSRRRVVVEEGSPGSRTEALTDHFLKVVLDRDPGPGLHWARIGRSEGPLAFGQIEA